jgi:hypothetical protein
MSETQRAQDEALQAYLDKMSDLLIDKELHKKKGDYDETRVTARAQTLAVLERLDAERKKTVLLFLREARLINRYKYCPRGQEQGVTYYPHYVGLGGADLSGAELERSTDQYFRTRTRLPGESKPQRCRAALCRLERCRPQTSQTTQRSLETSSSEPNQPKQIQPERSRPGVCRPDRYRPERCQLEQGHPERGRPERDQGSYQSCAARHRSGVVPKVAPLRSTA